MNSGVSNKFYLSATNYSFLQNVYTGKQVNTFTAPICKLPRDNFVHKCKQRNFPLTAQHCRQPQQH